MLNYQKIIDSPLKLWRGEASSIRLHPCNPR